MIVVVFIDEGLVGDVEVVDNNTTLAAYLKTKCGDQGDAYYNARCRTDITESQRMEYDTAYDKEYEYSNFEIHVIKIDKIIALEDMFDDLL